MDMEKESDLLWIAQEVNVPPSFPSRVSVAWAWAWRGNDGGTYTITIPMLRPPCPQGLKAPLPEPWRPCKTDEGTREVDGETGLIRLVIISSFHHPS